MFIRAPDHLHAADLKRRVEDALLVFDHIVE
jgi:hypothetical protein